MTWGCGRTTGCRPQRRLISARGAGGQRDHLVRRGNQHVQVRVVRPPVDVVRIAQVMGGVDEPLVPSPEFRHERGERLCGLRVEAELHVHHFEVRSVFADPVGREHPGRPPLAGRGIGIVRYRVGQPADPVRAVRRAQMTHVHVLGGHRRDPKRRRRHQAGNRPGHGYVLSGVPTSLYVSRVAIETMPTASCRGRGLAGLRPRAATNDARREASRGSRPAHVVPSPSGRRPALPVRPLCGRARVRHCPASHAVAEGAVMIDLSRMNGVRGTPAARRAYVGAGATLGGPSTPRRPRTAWRWSAGWSATRRRRARPHRRHGLAALPRQGGSSDNLVAATMVTADGRIVTASNRARSVVGAARGRDHR